MANSPENQGAPNGGDILKGVGGLTVGYLLFRGVMALVGREPHIDVAAEQRALTESANVTFAALPPETKFRLTVIAPLSVEKTDQGTGARGAFDSTGAVIYAQGTFHTQGEGPESCLNPAYADEAHMQVADNRLTSAPPNMPVVEFEFGPRIGDTRIIQGSPALEEPNCAAS